MKLKSPTSKIRPGCSLLVRCATARSAMKPNAPTAGTVRFYNQGRVAPSRRPMNPHSARRPGQPRGSPQPSAGNLHARCDVAGAGNGIMVWLLRHSQRKRGATARLDLRNTAPVLDPTGFPTAFRDFGPRVVDRHSVPNPVFGLPKVPGRHRPRLVKSRRQAFRNPEENNDRLLL